MKNKRMYAAAMAALMASSALTACGGSSTASTTAAAAAAETTAAAAAETTTAAAVVQDANASGQQLDKEVKVNADSNAEVQKGGTLIVSMPSSPRTLDPKDYSTMYENHIMYNIMETLFIWNGSYEEAIPYLVEDDYTISDDGLTYHFTLKDGIHFQKGQYQDGRELRMSSTLWRDARSCALATVSAVISSIMSRSSTTRNLRSS